MRIHTNATPTGLHATTRDLQAAGVYAHMTVHGSRTHPYAFEVKLHGTGYARNSGTYGASDEHGATWDEWGIWLNRLFELDPDARVGGTAARPIYANRADFREATGYRYDTLTVEQQHRRHRWTWEGPGHSVCKCGAERWANAVPNAHASLAR